jgi:hypothetical protein
MCLTLSQNLSAEIPGPMHIIMAMIIPPVLTLQSVDSQFNALATGDG